MRSLRLTVPAISCTLLLAAGRAATDKIPITTASNEARGLYLKGRELAEKLRATDARRFYEQAAAKDVNFALAHLGLANTAGTTKEFIDGVTRAAALATQVSEGERHMIYPGALPFANQLVLSQLVRCSNCRNCVSKPAVIAVSDRPSAETT